MALIGQAVSEEKIFEIVDGRRTDGRRTDGWTPDHGHPISSPCEPNGSGELKKRKFSYLSKALPATVLMLFMTGSRHIQLSWPYNNSDRMSSRALHRGTGSLSSFKLAEKKQTFTFYISFYLIFYLFIYLFIYLFMRNFGHIQAPAVMAISSGKHVRAMNTPLNPTFI